LPAWTRRCCGWRGWRGWCIRQARGASAAAAVAADREIVPAMTIHQLTDVDPFSVRVSVYRNLGTGGWSVKTAERVGEGPKGKVIAHADQCDHRRRL
jgi:protein subunit release factor A